MRIGRYLESAQYFLLSILAFAIPVSFSASAFAIGAIGVVWLARFRFKDTWTLLKERRALWPWMLLYVLCGLSYFYSENKEESLYDLETKFSLFIMPVIMGAAFHSIDKKQVERVFLGFIYGVTTAGVLSFFNATATWRATGNTSSFFYHDLVKNLDPNAVYMAWYALTAICILLFHQWVYHMRRAYRFLKVFLILFLFVFFILLSARMLTLLFFIFILPFYLIQVFRNNKFTLVKPVYIVLLIVIIIGGLVAIPNPIRDRFDNMRHYNSSIISLTDYSNVKEEDFNNVTLRLFIWRLGIEKMNEEHLWLKGGGNGDVHLMLNSKMVQYNFRNIHPEIEARSPFYNIDAHNMYLQILLMVGLPGLILLFFIVFMPTFYLNRNRDYKNIFIVFICSAIFFFFQEAVFQTQAGVVFYTFFIMLYWIVTYGKKKLNEG